MESAWPPVQTVLEVTGSVEVAALQRAIAAVCRAHPHLVRGFVRVAAGRFTPFEPCDAVPRLRVLDVRDSDPGHREAAALRLEEHERREEFPPSAPPLIRLLLIRTGDRDRRLVVTSHRMLLDDWSHAAVVRALLGALSSATYFDGAGLGSDRRELGDADGEYVSVAMPAHDLTSESYADSEFDFAAAGAAEEPMRLTRELPPDLTGRILLRTSGLRIDAESLVLGAWAFVLSRLTGRQEVAFGSVPVEPRALAPDGRSPIGAPRELVAVTAHVDDARSCVELLRAMQHGAPEDAPKSRTSARRVSFDTVAAFAPEPLGPVMPRLGVRIRTLRTFDAKPYPLGFSIVPGPSWVVQLDYQSAVLPARVAKAVLTDAAAFLEAVAYTPSLALGRIASRTAEVRVAQAAA